MPTRLLVLIAAAVLLAGCAAATYPPNPRALQNAQLAASVKTTLLNAPGLDATKIDVRAVDGVVTLEGVVASPDDEKRAVELVREVRGVTRVDSRLKLGRFTVTS